MRKLFQKGLDILAYLALVAVMVVGVNDLVWQHKFPIPVTLFTAGELEKLSMQINDYVMMVMMTCQKI